VTLSENRVENAGIRFIGRTYDRENHSCCCKVVLCDLTGCQVTYIVL